MEVWRPDRDKETRSGSSSSSSTRIAYKVRSGDNLGKIAARHHVTVNQIKSWNHLKSTTIRVGQTLYIYSSSTPSKSTSASASKAPSATSKPATSSDQATTYKVKQGDSLYKIAKRYGTTADKLMKYNGISSKLKIGQIIKIPPK